MFNKTEKSLLKKLSSGKFDGKVGRDKYTDGGSTLFTRIENGTPIRYKEGPGSRYFNGKENERVPGVLHILQEYNTDEEKVGFFQKLGWLLDDEEAKEYSSQFKPKKISRLLNN